MSRIAHASVVAVYVLVLSSLALGPLAAAAVESPQGKSKQAQDKDKGQKKGASGEAEPEFRVEFLLDFTSKEARRLAAEYELVGRKPLPPGIRKNLARGKPLPPGIAKQTMPQAFVERLPAHEDYAWRMAGTDLVLIAKTDNVVVEIAADVFD